MVEISSLFNSFVQTLTFEEATSALLPVFLFSIGMVIYSLFIFKFYKFIAKKDVFELNLKKYNKVSHPTLSKFLSVVIYLIEYVLLFPLFSVFWFLVLTFFLSVLTAGQTTQHILMISMAVVLAIRITAYYSEELSRDLAKMLPFGLLAVFVLDISAIVFSETWKIIINIPLQYEIIIYYLILLIICEFILRISNTLTSFIIKVREDEKKKDYLF